MTRPTTTGKAQDLITFTRSTTGTALAKISYGEELVTNGTFDDDAVGATPSTWETNSANASLIKQSDGTALFSSASFAYARVANADRPIIPAGVYKVSFSISDTSGSLSNVHVGVGTGGNTISGDGDYQYLFTSTSEQAYELQIRPNGGGTGAFKIDNISIKEVLYDQPDGTLQLFNHPINKPRIEYDASGNCLGLLVEETRSNRVPYSDLSAHWNWVNTTDIGGAATAPDGTQTATLMRENTAGTAHITFAAIVSASTSTTASIFAKAGGRRYLQLSASTNQTSWAVFDLEQGVVTAQAASGITATIEPYGNGWYRCNAALTLPASGTTTNFVWGSSISATSGDRSVYQGDGVSGIYLWGAQVETGSFPTSYIPTSGSNVTRAADVASLAVSEFGYNQDQGSVFINCLIIERPSTNRRVIDGNSNNKRWMYVNAPDNNYGLKYYDSTNNVTLVESGIPLNMKAAVAVTPTQVFGAANSSNVGSGAHNGTLLDISQFNFFANLTGHIKSVQYYPLRLSNAQLQALTV